MSFNSLLFFLLVFPTFILYYFVAPKKYQLQVVIVANLIFYAHHNPRLLALLLFSAMMDALMSYGISKYPFKRTLATIGVVSELGLLLYFKYAGLFYNSFFAGTSSASFFSFLVDIPLPIGISFYCFQGVSMLVDTFRGEVSFKDTTLARHFTRTIFFVSFFPHLIAGPIVKAGEFMPQISPKYFRDIKWETVIKFLVVGFFFKVVVADNLAVFTQKMLPPAFYELSSLNLITLLFGYSCQIFADFGGYSFIAIGLAALFGYRFPRNFNHPYISRSFSEFWTRWHMSLSTFLRNYLYIPLGGNRAGNARTYLNLFIVMFLGGLWHGARWSYAVWGIWHGCWLMIERFFQKAPIKDQNRDYGLASFAHMIFVFLIVTAGWLLFRLPDFSDVFRYVQAIHANRSQPIDFKPIFGIIFFCIPVVIHHLQPLYRNRIGFQRIFEFVQPAYYAILIFLIFTSSGDRYEFIYFQF